MNNFAEYGLAVPEILLPKDKDLKTWCVIACDQFTQDISYWENAEKATCGKPSTLNLILPEVYLSSADKAERLKKIRLAMNSYLKDGVFDSPKNEFIYIERKTAFGRVRKGLLCAVDLDSYEWKPFSKSLIRATEATIVERIPPRKEIRKGAPIESPHIMLLVNDPERLLVERAGEAAKKNAPVYSGDLMLESGSITGWSLSSEGELSLVKDSLGKLKAKNTDSDGSTFMFAVGDGNHSLATAKAVWDEYKAELKSLGKSDEEIASCPVRYALAEIVNIYDEGLTFEPIHRVVLGADKDELEGFLKDKMNASVSFAKDQSELEKEVASSGGNFGLVYTAAGKTSYVLCKTSVKELLVSKIQPVLDEFLKGKDSCEIDYIHGSGEVFRLGAKEGNVTLLLPPVAKDSFFATINKTGPLPRKSFSMGEASEKRFYLECRRLF
ncbi:MAG: DUF1015 domain-containing protein [Treponema sp.]|nr:DUF1015 domain-containing protein [Treponema sp.]